MSTGVPRKVKPDTVSMEITGTPKFRQFFVDGFWEWLNDFQETCFQEFEGKEYGLKVTSSREPTEVKSL